MYCNRCFVRNDILVGGTTPLESLNNYIASNVLNRGIYARYWIGSEIFLRPLSVFFNVSEIHGASAMLHVISAYGFVKVIMCLFISSGKCEEDKRIKRKKWVQS